MARILYIAYDGVLEPLGQSQVLSYLEKLADEHTIHLLSYEKPQEWQDSEKHAVVAQRIRQAGIRWHPRRYHKSPSTPATLYDIILGIPHALYLIYRHRLEVVHARSYVPGLIAAIAKRLSSAKFLFDIRGFWVDERVDGNIWPADSSKYRVFKKLEKKLFRAADAIVTLTYASRGEIQKFDLQDGINTPIHVIPTCANLERFTPSDELTSGPFVYGYIGSVQTWYLFDEVVKCFCLIKQRRPDARFLIVNREAHDYIRQELADHGVDEADVTLCSATHAQIPDLVRQMSAAAAIYRPVYSKIATSPTKLAEYLGCGVPVLGNNRVGDMESILEDAGVGVAITSFDEPGRKQAVDRLLKLVDQPDISRLCRQAAEQYFSLETGVASYHGIYRELT